MQNASVSRPAARVQESDEYSQTTVQIATGMGQIKMLRNNRIIRKKTIITERLE
jgi:hypothetical protein